MDEYQLKNFLKFAPARLGLAPKKHLLVHIPKNGGMALRESPALKNKIMLAHRRRLKSKRYADALRDFMTSRNLHPGYEHARLKDIDTSVRAGTIPFAVIRNPWARTFSRFKFYLQTSQSHETRLQFTKSGFETFLETRHEWGGVEFFWHRASLGWYAQLDYLTDENGVVAADVLRQEYLGDEIARYFSVPGTLERRNVSKNEGVSFKEFYDAASIRVIADYYKPEIETFGFDFDSAAQKATYFS